MRNKLEEKVFNDLIGLRGRKKYKVTYEEEKLPYTITRTYNPDFVVEYPDGHKIYIESKGFFRHQDMEKMRAIKEQYPLLDIRMVFDKDLKVRKNSKMRYSDWATKYGFPFAMGHVPKEWLDT